MSNYFSDRELGPKPRVEPVISPVAWAGIVAVVNSLADRGAFGASFPERCPDGPPVCGNDIDSLKSALEAEIQGVTWPLQTQEEVHQGYLLPRVPWAPPTMVALDFIEFVWRNVAQPIAGKYHDFFQHHHLIFDVDAGRDAFKDDVNRIFARNGLAYEFAYNGQIRRVLPAVLDEALTRTYFQTGDRTLDLMLEESRIKFSDPAPLIRREALERLFDCWERIKSLADTDKVKSIKAILDTAASELAFRQVLETDARELTAIGNGHLLRHHEIKQTPVVDTDHVDYLYHRLFAMVELLIWKNGP